MAHKSVLKKEIGVIGVNKIPERERTEIAINT